MTYITNPINDWQKQIIIGTILGGSSIILPQNGKNCYLVMRSKDKNWLNYKAAELKELSCINPFYEESNTYKWRSYCCPGLDEIRNLFYLRNKKAIKMETLDMLRDIGLAIWFGDKGKILKNNLTLNILSNHKKVIERYFNEIGISCKAKDNKIHFDKKGSEKLLMVIGEKLPIWKLV